MRASVAEKVEKRPLPYGADVRLGRFVITIETDDRRIVEAIWSSMETSRAHRTRNRLGGRSVRLGLRLSSTDASDSPDLPPSGRATASFENVELFASDTSTVLAVDRESVVRVGAAAGAARGVVSPRHLESPWILAHRIFYLSVVELLRRHGSQYLHAGCVSDGGRGIVVLGASGAGKSTLTYALARSGLAFVCDDGLFLERDGAELRATGFPERIRLDSRSCSFFDELGPLGRKRNGNGKHEVRLEDTPIRKVSAAATPVALVFPVCLPVRFPVGPRGPVSSIKPIAKHEAFVRLMGQSIPALHREGLEAHMGILSDLVDTSACFELRVARDFDVIPALVKDAVRERA